MPDTTMRYGVIVGVDGSAESDEAIAWAAREAIMFHLPLTLLHVAAPVTVWPLGSVQADIIGWRKDTAQAVIDESCKTLRANATELELPDVRTEVVDAKVVPTLVDASKDARMVVVGSVGMGAVSGMLLGSVATGLISHAHCPVAVIHAEQGATPARDAPILLGIDGSPASEAATALAFEEASRRGVELLALHAWSDDNGLLAILGRGWEDRETQGHEVLAERLAGWQERYPDVRVERRLVPDAPARCLLDESEHAQLVVVGSHGRGGFSGMLLGSVSSAVAHAAKVPVIVVRT
ncbi:universal stress protein [Mycobacterium branderi]|uniref:Universal stress protein n=1 Tax=Mycobacterium branderi TaxID=43348 RepID=A0A7I7W5C2_9MYCO|nr:universal stress protein [Mycobacterium branderi]MCV7231167.1 universal stress protein [Mycobacterium branderi]ORA35736.1 universal stress protein [Mycobacterium branderi]BBZ12786.1 universal stress protein [Mycobacterium branderi]